MIAIWWVDGVILKRGEPVWNIRLNLKIVIAYIYRRVSKIVYFNYRMNQIWIEKSSVRSFSRVPVLYL